jgi:phosphate-selective porin
MKTYLKSLLFILLAIAGTAKAQDAELTPLDTITANVQKLNSAMSALQKLKISGYLQAQYQIIETPGAKSFAGGDFSAATDNRFMVRRGRIKFAYDSYLTKYVLQFDVTEKGLAIKDAYLNVLDPYLNAFSITAGVFNRPFGYEIPYSSSVRESPERSRFTQTLFPGERDLGAMLTFQMPKTSPLNFLKIDAGFFSGNGTNPEFDKKKDFIGRIGIARATTKENIKFGLGFSYYNGGIYQGMVTPALPAKPRAAQTYELKTVGDTVSFVKIVGDSIVGSFHKRSYFGIDGQFTIETPLGLSTIRGEYIAGEQPGTSSSTTSPTNAIPASDTYLRKISGAYVYFVQSFTGTRLSVVAKYDIYDPNTGISGDQIGLKSKTGKTSASTAGDIKYNTLGLGLIYAYTPNIKFTAYYDMVKNETSKNLAGYTSDIKDNVWTLRLQYKF